MNPGFAPTGSGECPVETQVKNRQVNTTLPMFVLNVLPISNPTSAGSSYFLPSPFQRAQAGTDSKFRVESQAPGNQRWLANSLRTNSSHEMPGRFHKYIK